MLVPEKFMTQKYQLTWKTFVYPKISDSLKGFNQKISDGHPVCKSAKSPLPNESTFFGTPGISALPSYICMGYDILLSDKLPQVHSGTIVMY